MRKTINTTSIFVFNALKESQVLLENLKCVLDIGLSLGPSEHNFPRAENQHSFDRLPHPIDDPRECLILKCQFPLRQRSNV